MIDKKVLCGKKIIASRIVYCDNILRKASGLMFHSQDSVEDTAWWFRFNSPRRLTVTMFFVFFPIDLVFLDKNGRIIEMKAGLKPFSNYTTENRISSFVELKKDIIKRNSLKIGMKLGSG